LRPIRTGELSDAAGDSGSGRRHQRGLGRLHQVAGGMGPHSRQPRGDRASQPRRVSRRGRHNQSGVARGLFGMAELNAIHQKLHAAWRGSVVSSTASTSARTGPTTGARAASRGPGCCARSRRGTASISLAFRRSVTAFGTWRRRARSARRRSWFGPARVWQPRRRYRRIGAFPSSTTWRGRAGPGGGGR